MADYRDTIYDEVDRQFDAMLGAKDYFSDTPLVNPTPYETPGQTVVPVGWVSNASAADGTATVVIDAGGITITNGALTLSDQFGNNVITGAGFGASWLDFISHGFYNSHFEVGTTNDIVAATQVGTGSTVADYLASLSDDIPYWVVSAESGAGTFKRIADSTAVGGFALQWSGNEDATAYQDVPIIPGKDYVVSTSWRYTNSASEFSRVISLQFRKSDHSATGGTISTTTNWTTSQAAYANKDHEVSDVAPADARYLRVTFRINRVSGSPSVWVNTFMIRPSTVQARSFEVQEIGETFPGALANTTGFQLGSGAAASDITMHHGGTKVLSIDTDGQAGTLNSVELYTKKFAASAALLTIGGTSFPASPATDDVFYRTDLRRWYFYDGTRWLSVTLYTDTIPNTDALLPLSATAGPGHRVSLPRMAAATVYLESFWLSFYVAGGGSALGASHKWVCTLEKASDGSNLATINIDSGASSAWREATAVAVNTTSTEFALQVTDTKTGTPGNLYALPRIQYRLVAT